MQATGQPWARVGSEQSAWPFAKTPARDPMGTSPCFEQHLCTQEMGSQDEGKPSMISAFVGLS